MAKFTQASALASMRIFQVLLAFIWLVSLTVTAQSEFIFIKGGSFHPKVYKHLSSEAVQVNDFEILDHPLTNAEYASFISATGYQQPLHWIDGNYPHGKGQHPVIFINRWDVSAYLKWRSETENRVYRLPTVIEFEYAATAGQINTVYPWGNNLDTKHANYNDHTQLSYSDWKSYLKEARYGTPNDNGLYGMAGNVFQMCLDNFDPAVTKWKFRVSDPLELERAVMGGSWARNASYMQIGNRLELSPGLRLPDLGFRLVRAPSEADWHITNRHLSAVTVRNDQVYLSWSLYSNDSATIGFNVYRAYSRAYDGNKLNKAPVLTPNYIDSTGIVNSRYHYYVKPIGADHSEGSRSEWVGKTVGEKQDGVNNEFRPIHHSNSLVPVFGDLDGDGVRDCVIRMDNGIVEMSQDPGTWVQLEAFTSYGRSLWRKNLSDHSSSFGNANNVPFCIWDLDGDGKSEVISRLTINNTTYLAVLNGMTGQVIRKTNWPDLESDFARSSSRIHMSIAYFNGNQPFIITQTGLYENEIISAFDQNLEKVWEFESFAETSGSGSHRIEVADVDGDGSQEIFDGTTCLNSDGTLRWSIYRGHPDIVSINDFLPDRPGLEVYFMVETSVHAGIYMVDANNGEIIWKINREDDPRWLHGHHGWVSDIWEGSEGLETLSNRAGHSDHHMLLFSSDGNLLQEGFPFGYLPLEWDGDPTRELINGQTIGNYNGSEIVPLNEIPNFPEGGKLLMAADLYGDIRDELVFLVQPEIGSSYVAVVSANHKLDKWYVSPSQSLNYKLWIARNMGGGYKSVFQNRVKKIR